jgi:hypothetical protein
MPPIDASRSAAGRAMCGSDRSHCLGRLNADNRIILRCTDRQRGNGFGEERDSAQNKEEPFHFPFPPLEPSGGGLVSLFAVEMIFQSVQTILLTLAFTPLSRPPQPAFQLASNAR